MALLMPNGLQNFGVGTNKKWCSVSRKPWLPHAYSQAMLINNLPVAGPMTVKKPEGLKSYQRFRQHIYRKISSLVLATA